MKRISMLCLTVLTSITAGSSAHRLEAFSKMSTMTITLGENSKMTVSPANRDRVKRCYTDVLGCRVITKSKELDLIQFSSNFYIGVVYDAAALPEPEMLKALWLDIRTDDPRALKTKIIDFGAREEMRRKILDSGLVRQLEIPDVHLYLQAPGGQVLTLVGIDEDLSFYEGAGEGPDVAKVKEAINKETVRSGRSIC